MTIKPCPFCGSTKPLVFREGETFRWRVAECFQCGAKVGEERIQTLGNGTREEWEAACRKRLIEAWNTRADDQVRAALDCRTCANFVGLGDPCRSVVVCKDARQYTPTIPVQMWKDKT